MLSLPTGTVTFLFTDIEGSTRLWQQHPEPMKSALARHHGLLQYAIESAGGYVFQIVGDTQHRHKAAKQLEGARRERYEGKDLRCAGRPSGGSRRAKPPPTGPGFPVAPTSFVVAIFVGRGRRART